MTHAKEYLLPMPGCQVQGRPQADPTDAVALGPAPLGARAMVFGKIIHFARYTLRLRIQ